MTDEQSVSYYMYLYIDQKLTGWNCNIQVMQIKTQNSFRSQIEIKSVRQTEW